MSYTAEQFIEDVKKEARALREHATKEEIGRLNSHELDANAYDKCIYGQMAFHCRSERASELIFECCPRYFVNDCGMYPLRKGVDGAIQSVNGTRIEGVDSAALLMSHRGRSVAHVSAIEAYILTPEAKNANLISYLKGETDTLDL